LYGKGFSSVTRTLPVEIYASIGYYELNWAKLSTIAVVAIIPAIVFISLSLKNILCVDLQWELLRNNLSLLLQNEILPFGNRYWDKWM